MTKWENMIYEWPLGESHQPEMVVAKLNELGEQGWELVVVISVMPPKLFFKRARPTE